MLQLLLQMQKELHELFTEKLALSNKKEEKVEVASKKIKKKDLKVLNIEERELKYYEYEKINEIDVYTGVIKEEKQNLMKSIEFLKQISPCDKITELSPSTLTARGNLSNIEFNEEDLIKKLDIPEKKYCEIVKIGCNYGEIYTFPNIFINHNIENMLRSINSNQIVKIGCPCHTKLINVEEIKEHHLYIEQNQQKCEKLYEEKIKFNLLNENYITKKKINTIIKLFVAFFGFKTLSKDNIDELYIISEKYIKGDDLDLFNKYLDSIQNIYKIFSKYESGCVCKTQNDKKIPEEDVIQDKSYKKNSARGRKPKDKKTKRKMQGTGMYFSSQITFEIYNSETKKISKIKIFRNGNFQIPGVKKPDMTDVINPISILKNYLNNLMPEKTIKIPYIMSVMRNYTCKIIQENISIILNKLEDVLYYEKSLKESSKNISDYVKTLDCIEKNNLKYEVFRYFNKKLLNISEITNNSERYPGILVKFNKPIPNKENKKITIKILSSGKINFDGVNSELEVQELYYWMQYILYKYWPEISFDPQKSHVRPISPDSDEYESLYDE